MEKRSQGEKRHKARTILEKFGNMTDGECFSWVERKKINRCKDQIKSKKWG